MSDKAEDRFRIPAGIVAVSVTAGYDPESPVLRDVSFEARAGELVAVLGPNGAGKSTLVRVLAGTLRPASGQVTVGGASLSALSRREIAQRLAVVPQMTDVALGFRVRDVVAMGRAPFQSGLLSESADDRARVHEAIVRCDLEDKADRPVEALSGGEQRLVAIARALAQGATTLLLDEPGAHLDVRHAQSVYTLLRDEVDQRGLACVAVLHDLNAAAQYADRVVLLKDGRVLAAGAVDDVMTYQKLRDAFGIDLYVGLNEIEGTRYFVPMRPKR